MPSVQTSSSSTQRTLLRVDTTNAYAPTAGKGITHSDIASCAAELERVHETTLARQRGGVDADYACLGLHDTMPHSLPAIDAEAQRLRKFDDIIVIAIGGSNLGAMAVGQALGSGDRKRAGPRLHYLDNVDPDLIHDLLKGLRPKATAVIAISKSGGTLETATQYMVVRQWLNETLDKTTAREHQWVVADPKVGWLRALAQTEGLRALPVPPKVGGRYSVLSAVGLLPLAASGVDVAALLAGASANATRCVSGNWRENPALELAALSYLLDTRKDKRLSIFMPYVNALRLFGDWYRQLWAESLGKRRADGSPAGTLPVTAPGAVDQHSQSQMYLESRHDKVFSFVALDRWTHDVPVPLATADRDAFPYLAGKTLNDLIAAEFLATRQVITDYGHPNLTLHLTVLDAHSVGHLIDLYQRTTVYAGLLYGINPLDQPAVESGKRLAVRHLQSG
jgi:glucose-6-phosphate isomerase